MTSKIKRTLQKIKWRYVGLAIGAIFPLFIEHSFAFYLLLPVTLPIQAAANGGVGFIVGWAVEKLIE